MAKKVGLWIDHRQAVIITLTDNGAETKTIKSNAEKHIRAAASDPTLKGSFKARMIPADDKHEREFNEHLKIYYNKIIEGICNAESIIIFGPGETKNELQKHLQKNKLGGLVDCVESAGKMTTNQILARVCKYFNVDFPVEEEMVESTHLRMKNPGHTHPRQI